MNYHFYFSPNFNIYKAFEACIALSIQNVITNLFIIVLLKLLLFYVLTGALFNQWHQTELLRV